MKFLDKIADKEDLKCYVHKQTDNYCIELEYYSDLGEDCIITLVVPKLTKEEIRHAMYEYEEDFDSEEHATDLYNLHGKYGTPTSLRDLLQDADEQHEKLKKIYNTMCEVK